MTKLYELTNAVIGLRAMIDDESIDEQTFLDTLESIEGEIEVKAENLLKFERELLADVDAVNNEIKRLQRIKTARANRAAALREYLRLNMLNSGIDKIACPFFSITLKKAAPILVVEDDSLIPKRYFEVVTTRKLKRKELLDDLKAGKGIKGASIGESKRALLIK